MIVENNLEMFFLVCFKWEFIILFELIINKFWFNIFVICFMFFVLLVFGGLWNKNLFIEVLWFIVLIIFLMFLDIFFGRGSGFKFICNWIFLVKGIVMFDINWGIKLLVLCNIEKIYLFSLLLCIL